jgi:hypothetical protein
VRLWSKTWCETRVRFSIAAAALIASCVFARGESPQTIFILLVLTLGGGTLRQDQAVHFTAALPVTRARILAVRIAVGIAEVVALSSVIAIATRSVELGACWAACGVLVLTCSLACAALVASVYAGWLAGFAAVMGYEAGVNLIAREPAFDLYQIMRGGVGAAALVGLAVVSLAFVGLTHLWLRWRDL